MCGRFALYSDQEKIAQQFNINEIIDIRPAYNISPGGNIAVICQYPDHSKILTQMRWGLIPHWMKAEKVIQDQRIDRGFTNARVETIDKKPSFRSAFKAHRCLIIADGFYEWKTEENGKKPYYIFMKNQKPFAMAGIWEKWTYHDEITITSCSIITTAANPAISVIHNRMPIILNSSTYEQWLDPNEHDGNHLLRYLQNSTANDDLKFHSVSKKVNNASYDNPECIKAD